MIEFVQHPFFEPWYALSQDVYVYLSTDNRLSSDDDDLVIVFNSSRPNWTRNINISLCVAETLCPLVIFDFGFHT